MKGESQMINKNFLETLKTLADKRMNLSLQRICSNDSMYKEIMERVISLERQYESLNLEPEHKQIIDDFLAARDAVNIETLSLAYLAGMEDCIKILRDLELLEL